MDIKQISVFISNSEGRLAGVTAALEEAGINIRALALADSTDFGVLRLIVDDHPKCLAVLKEKGFMAEETSVIAVEVEDRPGGMHKILSVFHNASLNVEYMYAFVEKTRDNAIVIFRIEDTAGAITTLKDAGIPIVGDEVLRKL